MSIVPFFVADRPMSLRLLKGLPLQSYPNARIGIMAHANTSLNFQHAFHEYPCDNFDYCDAVRGPCSYHDDISHCPVRKYILDHTIKMCDSGIFTREGATLNYQELFEAYIRMGVEYGIIIDVFLDSAATLESAKEALRVYESFKGKFKLVGVAQGKSEEEYIKSYEDLKALGYTYIAIGGLLRKVEKTVRYVQVRDEDFMYKVLGQLREKYPDDWLFALGSFHPKRLGRFQELNTWGDYKGWIFQYEKRNETLNERLEIFATNHLQHIESPERERIADLINRLQEMVRRRDRLIEEQSEISKRLFEGRRSLKTSLVTLYEKVQVKAPEFVKRLSKWTTHGLLDEGEERAVIEIFKRLGEESVEAQYTIENIRKNREMKKQVEQIEEQLNGMNFALAKEIAQLRASEIHLSEETEMFCVRISELIGRSERAHRFEQVQEKIASKILACL